MSEISSLRDELRFLEERVGQASDRSDIKQDRQIVDERQLRKQIRRARDHVNQGDEEEGEGEEKFNAPVLELNLNPVEWGEFRASRKTVATSSLIIDILVGDPKLLGGPSSIITASLSKKRPFPSAPR